MRALPTDLRVPTKNMSTSCDEAVFSWITEFKLKHGRPLRVLHLGNIANNAYLNSKLLREVGVDSDVLCYDYNHIMGCPEWEECDLQGHWGDDFHPNWKGAGVVAYRKPRWFYHGRLTGCLMRIRFKYGSKSDWVRIALHALYFHGRRVVGFVRRRLGMPLREGLRGLIQATPPNTQDLFRNCAQLVTRCSASLQNSLAALSRKKDKALTLPLDLSTASKRGDISPFIVISSQMANVFDHYDIIQGYATDPIYPYLLRTRPYVAFEHGTIRSIPFQNNITGMLTANAYQSADHCFITNCDNILAAQRLGLKSFSFIPHPVNEDFLEPDETSLRLRDSLLTTTSSRFLVLHPSRQHWSSERHPDWEKGNDRFIEGFAKFLARTDGRAAAVMVEWGKYVNESKQLIKQLGISDRIVWVQPLPNRPFIRYIHACDAIADQFHLGAFGSLTPKALACAKPTLVHLNHELHAWAFSEMPPVLNVREPDEIAEALSEIYKSPDRARDIGTQSQLWYQKYHSNKAIRNELINCYKTILS